MTINDYIKKIDAEIINDADFSREISTGYCGDFLSFVMGNAPENSAWFTIMNNVNVSAVAHLTDVSVVVLCSNVQPDQQLLERAKQQNINIITTKLDEYQAALALGL